MLLARLKQKDEEWRRARLELSKGWKEVMEKNYAKSLDHRSFYFKQADRKATAPKALIAEMRAKVTALEAAVREAFSAQAEGDAVRSSCSCSTTDAERPRPPPAAAAAAAAQPRTYAPSHAHSQEVERTRAGAAASTASAAAAARADGAPAATATADAAADTQPSNPFAMDVEDAAPSATPDSAAAAAAAPREPITGVRGGAVAGERIVTPSALPPALSARIRALTPVMHFVYR